MAGQVAGYLIYHPKRRRTEIGDRVVYHDKLYGNQDPYVWNEKFLHTYCHMAQMSPLEGQVCFWLSGDGWPNFSELYCDLVFAVHEKVFWKNANSIRRAEAVVDSNEAFQDHYWWGNHEHPYKRRRRFTLKADPERSFQPQTITRELIDIVPVLRDCGIDLAALRNAVCGSRGSRPMELSAAAVGAVYCRLLAAPVKLRGGELAELRRRNPQLGSPPPMDSGSSCCGGDPKSTCSGRPRCG